MNPEAWKDHKGQVGDASSDVGKDFEQILSSGKVYQFSQDEEEPYKEGPITYNVFGDYNNNVLYMKMSYQSSDYYGRINSTVIHPPMIDRLFGIDVYDSYFLNWLSDMLINVYIEGKNEDEVLKKWKIDWENHKNEPK